MGSLYFPLLRVCNRSPYVGSQDITPLPAGNEYQPPTPNISGDHVGATISTLPSSKEEFQWHTCYISYCGSFQSSLRLCSCFLLFMFCSHGQFYCSIFKFTDSLLCLHSVLNPFIKLLILVIVFFGSQISIYFLFITPIFLLQFFLICFSIFVIAH